MHLLKSKTYLIGILLCTILMTATMPVWGADTLSDAAYMEQITLAFLDGETYLDPGHSSVTIQVAMVNVPEERLGSAQWYVNGEPREDYSNSAFSIYNGKTTAFEFSVPFTPETEDGGVDIALELSLNGEIRRIEKHLYIINYSPEWYKEQEIARVFEQVQPVDIEATVRYWTHTYGDKYLSSANGALAKGASVVYTDHYGTSAACIWIPEEQRLCWVPYGSVSVSNKDYTVYEDFSDEDKELFVNAKGYESQTEYLVWVNLERQRVNTFMGSQGNWDLVRVSTCSSGANITPTPAGTYTYCGYSSGWYHATYYVKPALYINLSRGIALHSILFNPNGTVQDGTQGTPASHGCVRMPLAEIQWLADYLPMNSTVIVF